MKDEDLSRPEMTVHIPKITLRLEDLAFLRSVGQPKSIRCRVGDRVINRLRFLDLIARAKIPRSPEEMKEARESLTKLQGDLRAAIKGKRWDVAANICYQLRGVQRQLEPIEDDVLTEKGRTILRSGEVRVRARKVGCV